MALEMFELVYAKWVHQNFLNTQLNKRYQTNMKWRGLNKWIMSQQLSHCTLGTFPGKLSVVSNKWYLGIVETEKYNLSG